MDILKQIEDYKRNPRSMLSMLKTELIITRLTLPFVRVYKREEFMKNKSKLVKHLVKKYFKRKLEKHFNSIDNLDESSTSAKELFKDFKIYNVLSFKKNALWVDETRNEDCRSYRQYNILLKKFCAIKDHIEFEEEKLLIEALKKDN